LARPFCQIRSELLQVSDAVLDDFLER
jgi:hypothetical protein